jgi:hypothetical protein
VAYQDGAPRVPETSPKPSPQRGHRRVPADRTVAAPDDWAALRNEGLTSVIDPTLIRVADLFLRGKRAESTADWAVIKANLASLVAFVDSLVLEPGIPVFDYWFTFFSDAEFSADDVSASPNRILETCQPVIVPVSVVSDVWAPLRADVFKAMRNAAPISTDASAGIDKNLTAMRWKYDPELVGENIAAKPSSGDPSGIPQVNSYLYVSLLFSAYAAQLGGTQVLSPDQSEALLLASSGDLPEGLLAQLRSAERLSALQPNLKGLFDELNAVMGEEVVVPVTLHRPCFLPYLLGQGARTPAELFAKAIAMREDPEVRDYRAWMKDTESDLIYDNKIKDTRKKEINTIAAALSRRTKPTTPSVIIGLPPSAGISLSLTRARDWVCSSWPGKRYRRLIQRLAISKKETVDLIAGVGSIWSDGAA